MVVLLASKASRAVLKQAAPRGLGGVEEAPWICEEMMLATNVQMPHTDLEVLTSAAISGMTSTTMDRMC